MAAEDAPLLCESRPIVNGKTLSKVPVSRETIRVAEFSKLTSVQLKRALA